MCLVVYTSIFANVVSYSCLWPPTCRMCAKIVHQEWYKRSSMCFRFLVLCSPFCSCLGQAGDMFSRTIGSITFTTKGRRNCSHWRKGEILRALDAALEDLDAALQDLEGEILRALDSALEDWDLGEKTRNL